MLEVYASSFADVPVPSRRWLVPDMLPDRAVAMLSGDGGVGKSLLALQLAVAMASGTNWVGMLPELGPVLYLSAEDELDEVHRRLADIVAGQGLDFTDLADLHVASLAGRDAVLAAPDGRSGTLAPTSLWHALDARIDAIRPRLLITDNLADVFGGNEISRPEARQFVGLLRGAAIRYDMGVLLIAHPSLAGLTSGSGSSGSTAWNNSVRARLYLDRPKGGDDADRDADARVLRTMKANYAPTGGETRLRWCKGVLRLDEPAASGLDRIAADADAERTFLDLLGRLARQGRDVSHKPSSSYAPAVFAKEPDNGGFQKRALERAMTALFKSGAIKVEAHGPPSKLRSRIVAR